MTEDATVDPGETSRPEKVTLAIIGFARNYEMTVGHLVSVLGSVLADGPGLSSVQIHLALGNPESAILAAPSSQLLRDGWTRAQHWTYDEQALSEDHLFEQLLAQAQSNGNPFPDRDPDTLRRSLTHLWLLSECLPRLRQVPGPVVFVRSDLLVLGSPSLPERIGEYTQAVRTPTWHRWSGINDRFAIVPRASIEAYFGRYQRVGEYLALGHPLYPERFLQYALRGQRQRNDLTIRLLRTRAGGAVVNEDFGSDRLGPTLWRNLHRSSVSNISRSVPGERVSQ